MRRSRVMQFGAGALALACAFVCASLPRAAAQMDTASNTAAKPAVIARNLTARAVAIFPGSRSQILTTTAEQPNRILTLGPDSSLNVLVGTGIAGAMGDGGAAANAQLDLEVDSLVQRSGIAVSADGAVFVADTRNSTIRRIAPPTSSEPGVIRSVAGRWAPPQNVALVEPLGLAVDRTGDLFIADAGSNSVLELHASTGQLETLAQVVRPTSLAATLDGRTVFVASSDSGRVFAIDANSHSLSTALNTIEDESSASASAPLKGLPSGLAVDGVGNLFVAVASLNRIYRLDAGLRTPVPSVAADNLHSPGDLTFDASGNLFVADQGRRQILEFTSVGAAASGVTLTPASFPFGNEPIGGSTPMQQFTLTNNSGGTITGISTDFQTGDSSDFQSNGTSCLSSLPTNSSCTINVAFVPSATGPRSSVLNVMSSVAAQQATLSGTGDDYELSLAPNQIQSLTVTAGNSVAFNLQTTNDAIFSGTVTFECPGNLPAATLCTITPPSATFNAPMQTIPFMLALQTTSRTKIPGTEVPPIGGSQRRPGSPLPYPALLAFVLLAASCAVLFGLRRCRPAAILFASILVIVALLGGCHHKGLTINGTPAGTTDLIVQGTAQNATRGVHIQLVVQ